MPFTKGDSRINRAGRPKGSGKPKPPRGPDEPVGPACRAEDVLADMLAVYGDPLKDHKGMKAIHLEHLKKDSAAFMKRLVELQEAVAAVERPVEVAQPEDIAGPDEGSQRCIELAERLLLEFKEQDHAGVGGGASAAASS